MRKFLICLLLVALVCAGAPALADDDDNFLLTLGGNPTTGYEWRYQVEDERLLSIVDQGYAQDAGTEGMTGAGGAYAFLFKGLKDGRTTVTFAYARSWETDEQPLYTIRYFVETDDDGDAKVYQCEFRPGM